MVAHGVIKAYVAGRGGCCCKQSVYKPKRMIEFHWHVMGKFTSIVIRLFLSDNFIELQNSPYGFHAYDYVLHACGVHAYDCVFHAINDNDNENLDNNW